jgi:hypothetical protein
LPCFRYGRGRLIGVYNAYWKQHQCRAPATCERKEAINRCNLAPEYEQYRKVKDWKG